MNTAAAILTIIFVNAQFEVVQTTETELPSKEVCWALKRQYEFAPPRLPSGAFASTAYCQLKGADQ